MNINHLPTLNKALKTILWEVSPEAFPVIIHFNEGMEEPQFKITIDRNETDTYTDSKGQIWKKIETLCK